MKITEHKIEAEIETEAKKTKAIQATYDTCNAKLQKDKELDMLYDIGGREASVQVLVGPTYFNVPIRKLPRQGDSFKGELPTVW